jgi:hypothetical protein
MSRLRQLEERELQRFRLSVLIIRPQGLGPICGPLIMQLAARRVPKVGRARTLAFPGPWSLPRLSFSADRIRFG